MHLQELKMLRHWVETNASPDERREQWAEAHPPVTICDLNGKNEEIRLPGEVLGNDLANYPAEELAKAIAPNVTAIRARRIKEWHWGIDGLEVDIRFQRYGSGKPERSVHVFAASSDGDLSEHIVECFFRSLGAVITDEQIGKALEEA